MRTLALSLLCILAVAAFSACGDDEMQETESHDVNESSADSKAGAAARGAAGSSGGSSGSDANELGMSDTAPRGTCPEGFACTRVIFPENSRACLEPGELFAPECEAQVDCEEKLPGSTCMAAPTIGQVCTLYCTI